MLGGGDLDLALFDNIGAVTGITLGENGVATIDLAFEKKIGHSFLMFRFDYTAA
jgi:hypothetical protein